MIGMHSVHAYILISQSCLCAEVNLRATESLVMKREEMRCSVVSLFSSPVRGGGMGWDDTVTVTVLSEIHIRTY